MRKSLLVAVFVLLGWISLPAHAQFCPGVTPWVFDDVPDTDPFCGFITDVANRGVTLGCQTLDPNHRLYCPNTAVPRIQMAAFLSRLATNLFPTNCSSGQVMKWNGLAWACANDSAGTGTLTSVSQGSGIILAPNPVVTTGTIAADTVYLQRRVSTACAVGSSIRAIAADGSVTCQADGNSGGTVTSVTAGAGLTGGTIISTGTIAVDPASATLTGNFFTQGGNAFGATAVLGTTDNNALDVRVNGSRVMRYEPTVSSPNVIGGHPNNSAGAFLGQTVGGGGTGGVCFDPPTGTFRSCGNQALNNWATIGGGYANRASGQISTVGGGISNTASGYSSTVGGSYNTASGDFSAVAGGNTNTASGFGSIVAGGVENAASGNYSFVAGRRGKALNQGCFVWSDSTGNDFGCTVDDAYIARASGGFTFFTNASTTTGVVASPGSGSWSSWSDRNVKANFDGVNSRAVLDSVARLPISTWNYRAQDPAIRHMGPTAQDFAAAFGVGENDTTISTVDAQGVALAAIQGLNLKLEAKIAEQARELAELRGMLETLLATRNGSEVALVRR